MVFQPGQSGNPKGYSGPRLRRHREIFEHNKTFGHKDALLTLSEIQNDRTKDEGLRTPFAHPKMQAMPVPFIENPIEVTDFTCRSRKSYPRVAMMQAGQDWCDDDGPRSLDGSS
jgi:hypothetical protein